MSAINNLKGHIVKDGTIVYSEQIENSLHFAVVLMYEPFYDKEYCKNSSRISCEAIMTTGGKHTYSNNVQSLDDAIIFQKIKVNESWEPLKELTTKDGFKVWQKDSQYQDCEELENGKKVKFKKRVLTWLVEVPKLNLLSYCKLV
jgi:hypothetical protein